MPQYGSQVQTTTRITSLLVGRTLTFGRRPDSMRSRRSNTGSYVSRTVRAPWFAELVGSAKRARVYAPTPPRTVEDSENWLQRQVARSFAKVLAGHGGGLGFVSRLAAAGKARFTAHDRMLIDQALGGMPA